MTPRERFLAVFNGRQPDRVPVTLFIQDQGHFLEQMYPDVSPTDSLKLQLKVIEIQRQFGVDIFVRVLWGINDPLGIHFGGLNVSCQTPDWQVTQERFEQGTTTVIRSTITTPDGQLSQDFSINRLRPATLMYGCTRPPIQTPDDLEMAIKYEPAFFTPQKKPMIQNHMAKIRAALGEDGIIGTWSPTGPFNTASTLIAQETLYGLFLTDYPFYEKLMNFSIKRSIDYLRAIDDAGVDVHCISGNVPGGFLGKRCYDEYILPFERQYIQHVQAQGTPAMYHNCGQIMNLVESYKDLGARIVEPFSPPPLGDADLKKAKQLINGAYVMIGGVDQVNVLQKGSVDDVKRKTEETIKIGKPGGKFILQSADFLEYGTPLKNLEAYVDTARQFSAY